ncbi:MAG: DUF3239 domain-containing protein [Planctomycetes bacterium]|nr:DUF3239 domain-containing protein [Planctomycetota bacterium]
MSIPNASQQAESALAIDPKELSSQQSVTLDDSARASNPGSFRVSPLRWAVSYPIWPCLWLALLLGSLAPALLVHWSFWILAGAFLFTNWFYWMRVRDHFLHGCVNPGMIVSLHPMRIAVYSDLTHGVGAYPAVKIIQQKLRLIGGSQPRIGTRLAVVSLYNSGLSDLPHWIDFDPRPVESATPDPAIQRRCLESIDIEDWTMLSELIPRLPKSFEPGLYILREDGAVLSYDFPRDGEIGRTK